MREIGIYFRQKPTGVSNNLRKIFQGLENNSRKRGGGNIAVIENKLFVSDNLVRFVAFSSD